MDPSSRGNKRRPTRDSQRKRPSAKAKERRSTSEGGKPQDPSKAEPARPSSVGSSREVRCACQFYMSDSLLPDRVNPIGTHPVGRVDTVAQTYLGDHEYEPVNPPPDPIPAPSSSAHSITQPSVQVTDTDLEPRSKHRDNIDAFNEKRLLRIPLDDELVVPSIEDVENHRSSEGRQQTPKQHRITQQAQLDERSFGTPDTSRAEEISTSQVDSSALEHLPLKKESRKKAKMAQPENQGPSMQQKIRNQADIFKTKLKGIKKPTFTIPSKLQRPNFQRPKFTRPKTGSPVQTPKPSKPKTLRPKFDTSKFKMPAMPKMPQMPSMPKMPQMPKMPDRPQINFPSFSMPRSKRQSQEEKQISTTESSAGSKRNIFDFKTYPRLFDRSKKPKISEAEDVPGSVEEAPQPEFATVPRATRRKGPVGARWVNRFSDIHYADAELNLKPTEEEVRQNRERADSLERRMEADLRFREAMEADEEMREYERENQNINRHSSYNYPDRWSHGSFHHTNENGDDEEEYLRNGRELDEQDRVQRREYDDNHQSERSSAGSSSGSRRRQGVLEEIDSDEFFLRQKGISQDNIQVGLYLSSEIRDAFRQPVNALSQMANIQPGYGSRDYEMDASDLSLTQPNRPKRKLLKKTKKIKKTPHVSQEEIQYDQESVTEPEEYPRVYKDYKTYPPAIPKRVKKSKSKDDEPSDELYQQEELVKEPVQKHRPPIARQESDNLSLPNLIGYVEKDMNEEYEKYLMDEALMYENEVMKDKERPDIVINATGRENGFDKYEIAQTDVDKFLEESGMMDMPKPPTRRHRSLRSLDMSEHDSIIGEYNKEKIIQDMPEQEINVYRIQHEYIPATEEAPIVPRRVRSRSRTESQADDDRTSRGAESIVSECQEPSCMLDLRDEMGYAIVDKNKQKERPPRPPTPKRTRSIKSNKSSKSETKFFTTPRPLKDAPPSRPTRNYSTLGPNRPPRKRSPLPPPQVPDEDKENIDITQYIEIEDETEEDHSRDLHSGEVISKMKHRPLPAPPRPPRKGRDRSKEALRDITYDDNIMKDSKETDKEIQDIPTASAMEAVEEIEVSTQTDPLPDDFCCEEVVQEPSDKIVAPRRRRRSTLNSTPDLAMPKSSERPKTPLDGSASPHVMIIERRVQTPTVDMNGDSTITHASLLVRPLAEYPPESYVSQRFAADIPSIFSEPLVTSPVIYPSHIADISLLHQEDPSKSPAYANDMVETSYLTEEPVRSESEEKEELEIMSLEKEIELNRDEKLEISSVQSEDDNDSEFRRNMIESIEDELECDAESEVEDTQKMVGVEETVPDIPEKPMRMKSQSHTLPESRPIPPQLEPPIQQPSQPQIIERIIERPVPFSVTPGPDTEVEVLKAQRLQVTDLDVERLNVTELQAQKILVSEIDGVSLHISELTSKSGNLVVNGLEIPSGLIQEILDKLHPMTQPQPPPPLTEQVSTQTDEFKPEVRETPIPETPILEHHKVNKLTTELIDISESPLAYQTPPVQENVEILSKDEGINRIQEEIRKMKEEVINKPEKESKENINEMKEEILIDMKNEVVDEVKEHAISEAKEDVIEKTTEAQHEEIDDVLTEQISNLQRRIALLQEQMTIDSMHDSEDEVVQEEELSEFDETLIEEIPDDEQKKTQSVLERDSAKLYEEELISDQESIKPKEFDLLKTETYPEEQDPNKELIIETKKEKTPIPSDTVEVPPSNKSDDSEPKKNYDETEKPVESSKMQRTLSQPVAASEVPQPKVMGNLPQSQVLHGLPYPVSYYPEYVHSIPPSSFYALRSPLQQDISEEDIPVHHRRRRPQRRLSHSSSEEDRRAVSRRHNTRSPEPTIPHLTGQLVRATANTVSRLVDRIMSNLSNYVLGSPEGKQDLQIAMIILLVLIAGLILLGFGGSKTIHLHHWEYFNPPSDL